MSSLCICVALCAQARQATSIPLICSSPTIPSKIKLSVSLLFSHSILCSCCWLFSLAVVCPVYSRRYPGGEGVRN